MPVKHIVRNVIDLNTDDPIQRLNLMFEQADHRGIDQFRADSFTMVSPDLTQVITFNTPLPPGAYEVFFQPQSNVSVVLWATGKTINGFTVNLSAAVDATFSYLAVSDV